MIDRIDTHPTTKDVRYVDRRSSKERRKIHTMLDPQVDRRKGTRREKKGDHRSASHNFISDVNARMTWFRKDS